jgi:hypothetical protein
MVQASQHTAFDDEAAQKRVGIPATRDHLDGDVLLEGAVDATAAIHRAHATLLRQPRMDEECAKPLTDE